MTLEIINIPVTPLAQNCRILVDRESGKAVIVDPGGEGSRLMKLLADEKLSLEAIWLTHSHLDHCGGVADLLAEKSVPLLGHPIEKEMRQRVEEICLGYGIPPGFMKNCPEPTQYIEGGETLSFGGLDFEVRFTPGHAPGHVVFYCKEGGFVLCGDTLFAGSVGRTDLPGSNHDDLMKSIQEQLYTLPNDTSVYCGHGPDTIIGDEKRTNPFVRGS